MIKITVDDTKARIEAEGNKVDLIIETGFALYQCIIALRQWEKSDAFIKRIFDIALKHNVEEDE